MTSESDRQLLLRLARDTITAHVTGLSAPELEIAGVLARAGAAFVSLHAHGDLRGCIGHLDPDEPLGRVIPRCAIGACSRDPRFPAVSPDELSALAIELSLLGPMEPIAGADDVEIGRHGLVVEYGWARGLLLPQVAVEWNWDAATFLTQTFRKAGVAAAISRTEAKLWRFEAEVFGDGAGKAGGAG
jgi:uncharacterized protein